MKLAAPFRAATVDDCYAIAQLFSIASDGVTDYVWDTLKLEYPGLTPLEIGATRYANPDSLFSYKNCVMVAPAGQAIGMMVTFPTEPAPANLVNQPENTPSAGATEPDVLAPYSLEAPGTWYICALALFSEFRGQGLGSQFLAIARQQAQEKGFTELSLLCFEQNTGALRLYLRNGFREIARTAVVPHPLIHYTGDVLLLTAPV